MPACHAEAATTSLHTLPHRTPLAGCQAVRQPRRDHPPRVQGAARSFAFASGMAALGAVLRLAMAGDHIVAGDDLYGGMSRLLTRVAPGLGLHVTNVDTSSTQCAPVTACLHLYTDVSSLLTRVAPGLGLHVTNVDTSSTQCARVTACLHLYADVSSLLTRIAPSLGLHVTRVDTSSTRHAPVTPRLQAWLGRP